MNVNGYAWVKSIPSVERMPLRGNTEWARNAPLKYRRDMNRAEDSLVCRFAYLRQELSGQADWASR